MRAVSPTEINFSSTAARKGPAAVLVIGGGIGGMRAALDLAEAGLKAYLVEQTPCLGGRVAQLGFMFPQHDCVLCRGTPDHGYGCTRPSISPAFIQQNLHPNITILTNTRVTDVAGQAGDFSVSLRQEPRYVDFQRCINCGYCAEVCPVTLPDSYQQGMATRKAAYKVAVRAMPDAYVIDRGPYCDECGGKCAQICPTKAIDLNEPPSLLSIQVGAIILAVGFQVYDARQSQELGFGRAANVLSAMQYERMSSRSGPSEGVLRRPSDGKQPASIAWLQCVGSRDQQNSYCSSICCMYATKEAILAKQRLGKETTCRVFIIDERAFNKEYSAYFAKARETHGIEYTRCRISSIAEDPNSGDLIIHSQDEQGHPRQERFEMVVLATGLQPPHSAHDLSRLLGIELNNYGFCKTDKFTPLQTTRPGVFVCGAFSSPKEIVETIIDASGAAGEAMRLLNNQLNSYPFSRQAPFLSCQNLPPEKESDGKPIRVGVFVCTCAGTIGGSSNTVTGQPGLDLQNLASHAARQPGVVFSQIVSTACFPEDLQIIQQAITDHDLNRVVIAACSNRTHDSLFQRTARQMGINPYLVEMVNLREQCSRVHHWQPEQANRKAQEIVRMAIGRVSLARPVNKELHKCRPAALVIGAGVSGMTAALTIADSGYEVHLIERSEMLGGNLLKQLYVAEGYNPQILLRDLVNRVRSHQRVHTYLRTEILNFGGHVGFFEVDLAQRLSDSAIQPIRLEVGAVIVATGGREARQHAWRVHPQVVTQQELEEKIIHRPEEIVKIRDIVIMQCVRPEGAADYCSRVCCTNTMKNAIRIKLMNPSCNVTVIYRNIVTYGFREEYYTDARRRGVVFIRTTDQDPPKLVVREDGRLEVLVRDLSLDRLVRLPADLIPLSLSILPAEGSAELAKMLRIPLSSEGFFQEAQMKLRPMDFMRNGIFLAGMAHYPKFLEESISHAMAAASRCLATLSPHENLYLGGEVAQVDPEKCVGCLTCTRVCPFNIPQVIQLPERPGVGGLGGAAYIDSAQCQGCGTCTGECPANAIQLINYSDQQIFLRNINGLGKWESSLEAPLPGRGD